MEFIVLAVVILFLLPFPAKWKFVWRIRFIGLAVLALIVGLTLTRMNGEAGQVGGVALMLVAAGLLYLALRPKALPQAPWKKR